MSSGSTLARNTVYLSPDNCSNLHGFRENRLASDTFGRRAVSRKVHFAIRFVALLFAETVPGRTLGYPELEYTKIALSLRYHQWHNILPHLRNPIYVNIC